MRKLKVRKVIDISDSIYEIFLDRGDFDFKVGNCVAIYGNDGVTSRPYSIASSINSDTLSFIIKRIDNGIVSNYLYDLNQGDEVKVSNPYGWFTPGSQSNSVFISTGTGISPFMCSLRSNIIKPKMMYVGVRESKDINYYLPYLLSKINIRLCLSKEKHDDVINCRVTDQLQNDVDSGIYNKENMHFYMCGVDSMIEDCSFILTSSGFNPSNIHHECFFNAE